MRLSRFALPAARSAQPRVGALLLVTGTGALSTDTYISALPQVQESLHTSSAVAQLTMTAFIIGSGAGQLLSGPISDTTGRRRMIVAACLAFTVLSMLCAVATTGWLLVGERALQGIAAGTAIAVGRAVVNDTYTGRRAAAVFGTLSAVSLIGPVVAPPIGGVLVALGNWRTVFWLLAAIGLAMTAAATLGLPESLPEARRHPAGLAGFRQRTGDLLTDRHFVAPVLVQCLTTAGFFVYIGGSSFVLQQGLGLSAHAYTAVFTLNAITMVLASTLFRLTVTRIGPVLLRRCAICVHTIAVLTLFLVTVTAAGHRPHLVLICLCLATMTAGLGMYLPASATIVQNAGRRAPGTASALGGGLPFIAGACATPLTGALGSQTVLTMSACMAALFTAAAVAAIVLRSAIVDPFAPDQLAARPAAGVPETPPGSGARLSA